MSLLNKQNSIAEFIASLCIFLCIPPYFVWHTPVIPLACFIAGLISLVCSGRTSKGSIGGAILLMLLYFFYSFRGGFNFFGWLGIVSIIPFFFTSEKFLRSVYSSFYKIFIYTMIISFIVYILVSFLGIHLPFHRIEPLNLGKVERYFAYPFLVYLEDSSMRFCSLYDEPGVVGTISGMILLIERFNFKKWENIVLMIMAVFSFSMFFFVICILYVLFFGKAKYKILITAIGISLVVFFWNNEILYELIFKRFTLNADGKLVGNTRDNEYFSYWYQNFRTTPAYITGLGPGKGAEMNEGGCSYKQLVVDYGIVFFLLYIISFYILSKNRFAKIGELILYSLVFITTIYQRPFIGNISYVFFFIAGAVLIRSQSFESKDNINESVNYRTTS